ncbi:TIR domain-containing protein [Lentzea sp. NPDC051838]|uniref:nSTAND1 domain-containing NTPase n=1 Tax=Lentzea sp. NPDC051838 TaxID=3154849 RepID=UPI00343240D3
MASLFLSHSAQDRSAVDEVRARLAVEGFDAIFLDYDPDHGIPAGRSWETELYSALRRADAVLFVATESSVTSRWCFAELALARSTGKPVFPVRMSSGVTHSLLGDVQWVDVTAEGDLAYTRLWTAMKTMGVDPSSSFDWDATRSPFPGLAAYGPADAAVFFGRSDLVSDLLARVEARRRQQSPPFLTIVGPSGSGKSSVVRAGLVPRLHRRPGWVVVDPFRPGARPISALARALDIALTGTTNNRTELEQRLRDPAHIGELMKDLAAGRGEVTAVLLVIDQAEELLRGEDIARFVEILRRVPREDPHVQIVCTLRSEFLGAMASDPDLAALVREPVVVSPLPRSRLPEVIEGPAQRAGVSFAPGLVQRMVEETTAGEALPLLGYALQQLYQRRQPDGLITLDAYLAVGGVEGALRQRADEVREALRAAGHGEVIIPALLQLVTVDEHDEPLSRPVAIDAFLAAQREVVDSFVEARLLSTDSAGGSAFVRVAHETLFWAWPPIREAITASRQALRTQTELERLARDWERARRPDSYLLREERLGLAAQWLADQHGAHTLLREFVDASRTRDLAGLRRESELAASRVMSHLGSDPERGVLVALAAIEEYARTPEAIAALDAAVRTSRLRGHLRGHDAAVNSVVFSPDGTRVLTASDDGTARVWNVENQREILKLQGHSAPVRSAEYSSDGTRVLTASEDKTIRVWDANTGAVLFEQQPDPWSDTLYWATISPDGKLIAAVTSHGRLDLLNAADGARLSHVSFPPGRSGIYHGTDRNRRYTVAFSRNGLRVAAGSPDGAAHVWNVKKPKNPQHEVTLAGHAPHVAVHSARFTPDGSYLVTTSADGTVQIQDIVTRGEPQVFDPAAGQVYAAEISDDATLVVAATQDRTAVLFDAERGTVLASLTGHGSALLAATFSLDGTMIATGDEGGEVRLWSTATWGEVLPIPHDAPVFSACFSPDGARILTTSGRTATVVSTEDGSPLLSLTGHAEDVVFAAFAPDGSRIVTSSYDYSTRVWSSSGELEYEISGHDSPVQMAAFSSDGTRVITCAGGRGIGGYVLGGVKVWDVSGTGRRNKPTHLRLPDIDIPSGEDESVRSAMLSPDGTRIVASVGNATARVWDAETRALLFTLTGHENLVNYAEFSPDGSLIVTASDDSTARVWDAADGTELTVLSGHRSKLGNARFSPDGSRIVTASADGTALVWDRASGKPVSELWHGARLIWADFSPDTQYVVTAGGDGMAWVWDHLQPDELISFAKRLVFRSLTAAERQEYGLPERQEAAPA